MYHFFSTYSDLETGTHRKFLVTELPLGEKISYVLETLYQHIPPQDRANVEIILRPSVKVQLKKCIIHQIFADQEPDKRHFKQKYKFLFDIRKYLKNPIRRFQSYNMYILASDNYKHYISDNINTSFDFDNLPGDLDSSSHILNALKRDELDHLVRIGNCKLPRLGVQYYKVPSGRYVSSFLRVGNLQTSRSAIDAIFFWLLPHLDGCIGVISDTWSISSISQNVSRRLAFYDDRVPNPCPIEMLGDYHDNSDAYARSAAETIERFVLRIPSLNDTNKVLVLISATQTGSLVELLSNALELRGLSARVQYVAIFQLSKQASKPSLRDYSCEDDFRALDANSLSNRAKSCAISIDPKIYFPVTSFDVEKRGFLKIIEPYTEFVNRYHDIAFARIHYTDQKSLPNNPRHHTIWIDTEKIASHKNFVVGLQEKLLGMLPKPTIIICPNHLAAKKIASLAQEIFARHGHDAVVRIHDNLSLDKEVETDARLEEEINRMTNADSILFIDDAYVTGARITSYQKNVRELSFSGVFHYLAAVARPDNAQIWNDQKKAFLSPRASEKKPTERAHPHTFDAVEHVVLPNWSSEEDCPWCIERDLGTSDSNRKSVLDKKSGIEHGLFILPKGCDEMELGPGSFIGPENLAHSLIYFVVAGAMQRLRTEYLDNRPLLGEQHFIVSTVFSSAYYLRYFTDSVLQAAFFRSLKGHEMVYRDFETERKRTDTIKRVITDTKNHDLVSEVIFAAKSGKFPQIDLLDSVHSEKPVQN